MAEYREDERFEEQNAHDVRMQDARGKYKGMSLRDLVITMKNVQAAKDDLENQLKDWNAKFDVLRFELIPEKMDEEGVERVSYDGIGRVSLTADIRVATLAAAKPKLFSWLKKNRLGDLLREDINPSTLKSWIKQRMKDGKALPPDDLVKVTPITRASITKA